MSASPVAFQQRVLIFDTGPLWELVLYSAVHDLRFETLENKLQYLKNRACYRQLSEFVASFRQKTTTPHVVAEMSSLIMRNTQQRGHLAIWGLLYREFSLMGMDENVVRLLEMPQQLVADFGAPDAGILKLASGLGRLKPLVLSVDSALIEECKRAGVDAKDLWEVIS